MSCGGTARSQEFNLTRLVDGIFYCFVTELIFVAEAEL
jgi:hypothetical protein